MELHKHFTQEDQLLFAEATGDFNPVHMDPLVARRTQAGAPIVHGIHTLLWMINTLACLHPELPAIASMKVRFVKMLYVGEKATIKVVQLDEKGFRAEAMVAGLRVLTLKAECGDRKKALLPVDQHLKAFQPTTPLDLHIEDISGMSGVAPSPDPVALEKMFPHAARYLGKHRASALGCSTYLVGMIVPGLHSIYHGLGVEFLEGGEATSMQFSVVSVDPRFRLVEIMLQGGGLCATLETFVRMPPIQQASIKDVATIVKNDEFSGVTALIVGGSRGLGELTAKIIAAGGGSTIITYARGKNDADRLSAEITAHGSQCNVMRYNVLEDSEKQIVDLHEMPTHLYYFATPPLLQGPSDTSQTDIFDQFYTTGFQNLIRSLFARFQSPLRVLYPSSIAVEKAPAGMEEYAHSKARGERLCIKLMQHNANLHILSERLPRILTDLTASIQRIETADAKEIMLPIIRKIAY
jgi:acyl dehydratase/NAD(P)-dependent dehydrogenase (short-subunit alcohol dehydrogenase family)